ncbi:hypothetical protein GCM10020000_53150 [Streptomyces olivoverticillatus]
MGPVRFPDLGRFLLLNSFAQKLLPAADEALGYSLFDAFRESGEDYSEAAQVAFMVACTALADWAVEELGAEPEVCVGPSFGEKPLIGFCGALDFADAVTATARLARCTAAYFATEHRDVVTQSFVRAPAEALRELLAEHGRARRVARAVLPPRRGLRDGVPARAAPGGLPAAAAGHRLAPPLHHAPAHALLPLRRSA